MKGLAVILCVVSVVLTSSLARATELSAGLLGGVNRGDLSGLDQANASSGFTGGGFLHADFNTQFGARLGAIYVRKGAQYNSYDFIEGAENVKISLDYIDVPLVLVVGLAGSESAAFKVYGGPVFSFALGGEGKANTGVKEDLGDNLKGTEFSGLIGVEGENIRSSYSIVFDFQYTIGATTILENVPPRFTDTKNRGWAVMAGVKFGLGG